MVIQVRGNHGSGKSTAVRALIQKYGIHTETAAGEVDGHLLGMAEKHTEIIGYILHGPGPGTFIVGPYKSPTGGCDVVKRQDYITNRVKHFHDLGYHVVFEGILASITYQRYADLADYVGKSNYVFGFLATTKEQSYANIAKRRESSTVVRGPFKDDLFDAKVAMLARCHARYIAEGYRVEDLAFGRATDQIDTFLTS